MDNNIQAVQRALVSGMPLACIIDTLGVSVEFVAECNATLNALDYGNDEDTCEVTEVAEGEALPKQPSTNVSLMDRAYTVETDNNSVVGLLEAGLVGILKEANSKIHSGMSDKDIKLLMSIYEKTGSIVKANNIFVLPASTSDDEGKKFLDRLKT